jgi:ribosomal protein S18 acetylase RimI-like enzyme
MSLSGAVEYRRAQAPDADPIAALHADSWQRHYRGAYSDAFLDGDVLDDRRAWWTSQLMDPQPNHYTVVAETRDDVVGFAHTILDADETWGALLDNLHVTTRLHRCGIGTHLMVMTADYLLAIGTPRLFLWVLEQNTAAQRFYASRGGANVERAAVSPPGGNRDRLAGTPMKLRFAWTDISDLVA